MRDQARALVWPRRTAVWHRRNRDDHPAAILHRFDPVAQHLGLRTGLPRVRHRLDGGGVIAFDDAETGGDAGRQHEAVIGQRLAFGQADGAGIRVDPGRAVGDDVDPVGVAQAVVAHVHGRQRVHARDHRVAHRTGDVSGAAFDQRDVEARIGAAKIPGAGRAAETAAHDDDAARGARLLREEARRSGEAAERAGRERRGE